VRALLAVLTVSLLAGCASVNEGASDVRRLEPSIRQGQADTWVLRSDAAREATIAPGDNVLITVSRFFVSDFEELRFTPGFLMTGNNPFEARGEIAVLMASSTGDQPISATSLDNHIVVHYSGDTREGQFSNFRNQYVFGPARVDSNFLTLEFVLLEIDRPTDQDTALFQKLAGLGKSLAGATVGPTFDILSQLGASLLAAPNDDVEMRYRVNFDLGDRAAAEIPLAPGKYVIIREEQRGYKPGEAKRRALRAETIWTEICLDAQSTLRWRPDGARACPDTLPPYVNNTYIVLNVETDVPAQTVSAQTFSELVEDLRRVQSPTISALHDSVTDIAARYAVGRRVDSLDQALARMRAKASEYGRLSARLPCVPDLADRVAAARQGLARDTVDLHAQFVDAAASLTDENAANDFDRAAYVESTNRLTRYFGELHWAADPETPVTLLAKANDPARFSEAFGDVGAFHKRVDDRALAQWSAGCSTSEEGDEVQ
jgi:hypothetical protein